MTEVKISLFEFKKYVKLRYILVTLVSIIFFNIIFGALNIIPDYAPIGSVYDGGDFGYSDSLQSLNTSVIANRNDISHFKFNRSKLLLLISSRYDYLNYELKHIAELRARGQPMLILGTGNFINKFIEGNVLSSIYIDSTLVDYKNSKQGIFNMNVSYKGELYVSANAYSLNNYGNWNEVIKTLNTASMSICYPGLDSCRQTYTIGLQKESTIVIADDLMFRNKHIREFPQNIKLLNRMISSLSPDIKEVVIDETHLSWIAVSHDGLANKVNELANSSILFFVVIVLAVIAPLLFGLRSGIFSSSAQGEKGLLAKRIMERFEIIHTDNMISVPLSKEEKILTNELIAQKAFGKAYFISVANYLVDYIRTHGLDSIIDKEVMNEIIRLRNTYVTSHIAWKIIERANYAIDTAQREESQYFERRNEYG